MDFLFDKLPGLIYCKDKEGYFTKLNQQAKQWLGFSSSTLSLGQVNDTMINSKASLLAKRFIAEDDKVISTNANKQYLVYAKYADGFYLLLGEKKPLLDQQGQVVGTMGVYANMTAQLSLFNYDLLRHSLKYQDLFTSEGQFSLALETGYPDLQLTKRHQQCLFLILRGYSAKGIANKLRVASKTIEHHVAALKQQLQCTTKHQLIEKCIAHNYHTILPQQLFKQEFLHRL